MTKLAYYRQLRDLSQEQLATQLKVSPQEIKNWETGQTNPDYIQAYKLASALKADFGELFPIIGYKTRY